MIADVDVRLLGPLDVRVAGRAVQFDGAKQRALFTALALKAPEAVSVDELVEALWADAPPGGAVQALQKQVSRLRQRLGDPRPSTGARRATRSASMRRRSTRGASRSCSSAPARRSRRPARVRRRRPRAALALWRGRRSPSIGSTTSPNARSLGSRSCGSRRSRSGSPRELAGGRDADLVGELRALVAEHPLRERLRAHLMVALYRSGRQAEALEVMREGRRLLIDELGIEPGPELRRLERRSSPTTRSSTPARPARAPPQGCRRRPTS